MRSGGRLHARLGGAPASAAQPFGARDSSSVESSSTRSTARSTPSAASHSSASRSRSRMEPTWATSHFGYVYDFGSGEEWTAERGNGARLNGAPLAGEPPEGSRSRSSRSRRPAPTSSPATRPRSSVVVHRRPRASARWRSRSATSRTGRVDAVCSLKAARVRSTSPPAQLLVPGTGLRDRSAGRPAFRSGAPAIWKGVRASSQLGRSTCALRWPQRCPRRSLAGHSPGALAED